MAILNWLKGFYGCGKCSHTWKARKDEIPAVCPKCKNPRWNRYTKPDWAVQQTTRASGLVEDICKHGVGHPNKQWLEKHDPPNSLALDIHGCDGCCGGDK